MVLRVLPAVRIRSRPDRLVEAVEVVVGRDAAADRHEQRDGGAEAAVVVVVELCLAVARAVAALASTALQYSKWPISSEKATL